MKIELKPFAVAACLVFSCAAVFAAEANLYDQWSHKSQVKICVLDIKPAEGKKADVAGLKKEIEKTLQNRKSIHFVVLPDRAGADIVVEGEVLDFYWTDHDPVDMLMGAGAAAYDAMTIENYARMDAHFKVTDATGKTVWEDKPAATITSKTLTEAESPARINEDMGKVFVSACFGKKRARG